MSAKSPLLHSAGEKLINSGADGAAYNHSCKDLILFILIAAFLVTGGVALVLLLVVHPISASNHEYGVVFDAGSSHTSMFVYKWPGDKRRMGTAVPVDQVHSSRTTPGISFFVNDPSSAGPSLNKLIEKAVKSVPQHKRSSTPVFLGATAGMRLVRDVNETVSKQIMSSVRNSLSKSAFQHFDSNVKIISGKDEGSFGWITVNYLQKVLLTSKPKATSGALDLGGASTQITFVSGNTSSKAITNFKLYGRDYPVYAKTYLCYGLNEIYRRFLAELAKSANHSANISNPCGLKGSSFIKNTTYLWQSPCSCPPTSVTGNLNFTFYGSNNSSQCSGLVTRLFTENSTCPNPKGFSRGDQPRLRGNFLAFSGYYYTAINGLNLSSTPTMREFRSAYEAFCNKSKEEVGVLRVLTGVNPSQICFAGHYVYALLTQGYEFDNRTWNITFVNTVDKKTVGWSLGYMINATNLIPTNDPEMKRLDDEILVPAVIVCGIVIVIGFLLCFKFIRRKKTPSTGYSAI